MAGLVKPALIPSPPIILPTLPVAMAGDVSCQGKRHLPLPLLLWQNIADPFCYLGNSFHLLGNCLSILFLLFLLLRQQSLSLVFGHKIISLSIPRASAPPNGCYGNLPLPTLLTQYFFFFSRVLGSPPMYISPGTRCDMVRADPQSKGQPLLNLYLPDG